MTTTSLDAPDRPDSLIRSIGDYLHRCRELNRLCTQNGWIDNETLNFCIERWNESEALVTVDFTEVIMEGSGCVADRKPCFGRLLLTLDSDGRIISAREA